MSQFAAIAGSGAGLVIIASAWLLMRHLSRLPRWSHPWLHRAVILGMYTGGATLMLTELGRWIITAETWVLGFFGGTSAGLGHAGAVIAGLVIAVSVIVGLIWAPDTETAYQALGLPALLVLSGGHLHALLTVVPGPAIAQWVSSWIGG